MTVDGWRDIWVWLKGGGKATVRSRFKFVNGMPVIEFEPLSPSVAAEYEIREVLLPFLVRKDGLGQMKPAKDS